MSILQLHRAVISETGLIVNDGNELESYISDLSFNLLMKILNLSLELRNLPEIIGRKSPECERDMMNIIFVKSDG